MSGLPSSLSILDHFSALRDHREQWRVLYPLRGVFLLVLGVTLWGLECFLEIRVWSRRRVDFWARPGSRSAGGAIHGRAPLHRTRRLR